MPILFSDHVKDRFLNMQQYILISNHITGEKENKTVIQKAIMS